MALIMVMITFTTFATPKVVRESKWNHSDCTYNLMYDEDNTYGGNYYIYRKLSNYTDVQDRIIGTDLMEYWLARENNQGDMFELTEEKVLFSQEDNTFIVYVRVNRRK